MNYNRNLFQQINRLTNEVTGSYRTYNPPEPPVVTDTVTITTQPTDVTCYIGDTATFTVVAVSDDETATLSYQWQLYDSDWLNIQGATSSSYTAPTLDEKEVNYRCVITSDKGGTATSETATLTVEAVPVDTVTIVSQPSDTTAYIGGEFSFITVADTDDETATLSYQWQIYADSTWTDISGAIHATYVGTAPSTTGTADYRCVVTSTGGGTATTDTATLTVEVDTVTITAQPQSASAMVGDTVTLSVTATSDAQGVTLSYQWQVKDGSTYTDISGATSSTYTVDTTTLGTERYRVVVTSDKGGTATSNYADVTVETETITITAQPQSTSGYVGDTITLSVTATSNSPSATLSYQWQYEVSSVWTDISGATSSTYTVPTPSTYTLGYRVIITSDMGGTATSNTADVVIKDPTMLYDGDRIIITGLASGATIDGSHFAGKTTNSNEAIAFSTMVNADVFDVAETNDGLTLYSLANNGYMNTLPSKGINYVASGYTYYNNSQGNTSTISYGNYTAYGGTNISIIKKSNANVYMVNSSGRDGIYFGTSQSGAKMAFIRISDADYVYSVDFTTLNALPSEWVKGGKTMLKFTSNGLEILPTDYSRIDRCYVQITDELLSPSSNYIVLANFYSNGGSDSFMRCDDTLSWTNLPIPHTGWYVLPLTTSSTANWEFFVGYTAFSGNSVTLRSLQIIKVA